jgi:hypothetical protein
MPCFFTEREREKKGWSFIYIIFPVAASIISRGNPYSFLGTFSVCVWLKSLGGCENVNFFRGERGELKIFLYAKICMDSLFFFCGRGNQVFLPIFPNNFPSAAGQNV